MVSFLAMKILHMDVTVNPEDLLAPQSLKLVVVSCVM